jgi:hypothetical protein
MMDNGRKMIDLQKNKAGEYIDDRTHMMGIAYCAAMIHFAGRRKSLDRRAAKVIQPLLELRKGGERRKV